MFDLIPVPVNRSLLAETILPRLAAVPPAYKSKVGLKKEKYHG